MDNSLIKHYVLAKLIGKKCANMVIQAAQIEDMWNCFDPFLNEADIESLNIKKVVDFTATSNEGRYMSLCEKG